MKRLLAVVLVVAGCGAATRTETPPAVTQRPVVELPQATDPPWPTAFGTKMCIAMSEHSLFVDDLAELQTASEAGDLDRVSLKAYSLGADVLTIDFALDTAPTFKPAAELITAWRKALAAYVPAFDDIDAGAAQGKRSLLDRGSRRLAAASKLLAKATPELDAFIAATGFTC